MQLLNIWNAITINITGMQLLYIYYWNAVTIYITGMQLLYI